MDLCRLHALSVKDEATNISVEIYFLKTEVVIIRRFEMPPKKGKNGQTALADKTPFPKRKNAKRKTQNSKGNKTESIPVTISESSDSDGESEKAAFIKLKQAEFTKLQEHDVSHGIASGLYYTEKKKYTRKNKNEDKASCWERIHEVFEVTSKLKMPFVMCIVSGCKKVIRHETRNGTSHLNNHNMVHRRQSTKLPIKEMETKNERELEELRNLLSRKIADTTIRDLNPQIFCDSASIELLKAVFNAGASFGRPLDTDTFSKLVPTVASSQVHIENKYERLKEDIVSFAKTKKNLTLVVVQQNLDPSIQFVAIIAFFPHDLCSIIKHRLMAIELLFDTDVDNCAAIQVKLKSVIDSFLLDNVAISTVYPDKHKEIFASSSAVLNLELTTQRNTHSMKYYCYATYMDAMVEEMIQFEDLGALIRTCKLQLGVEDDKKYRFLEIKSILEDWKFQIDNRLIDFNSVSQDDNKRIKDLSRTFDTISMYVEPLLKQSEPMLHKVWVAHNLVMEKLTLYGGSFNKHLVSLLTKNSIITNVHKIATILSPCFKKLTFVKNDETKLEAMKILRTFYNQWKIASLDICIEEEVEIAEEPLEIGSGSCELLDPDPFKSVIEKEIRSTIDDELDYYISLQPEECKNPLIYWNTNQTIKVLKFLPEMAKFFISMPPTADHRIDLNLTRENLPPGFTNIKYLAILNMLRGDAAFYSDKLNSKPDVNDEN